MAKPSPSPSSHATSSHARGPYDDIEIDLRNPVLAGVFAWLWPGAGHFYQRRYAKGCLFMVCVLSTFFYGLALADGKGVYVSWQENDKRWPFVAQFVCQAGVGLPVLPAVIQNRRVLVEGRDPLWSGWMAPPNPRNRDRFGKDELAQWHEKYNSAFEMATLYTMIAGLLNVLAIYDAYAGPFLMPVEEESDKPPPEDDSGNGNSGPS